MRTIFINGKFAAQRVTGVQRLAGSLVEALDHLLDEIDHPDRWVILCPPGASLPTFRRMEVRHVGFRRGGLHAWEQGVLPLCSAGRTLLNLAGPAPLLKRRQVCMIPDAAVFDRPHAYTPAFGRWYRLLFRSVASSAQLLLTISEFSKGRLAQALGHAGIGFQVVPCAATHMTSIVPDTSVIQRLGLTQTPYLLAVGSLNPTKNLPALIAAFRALPDADLRLVLVGAGNTGVFSGPASHTTPDARVVATGAIDDGQLAALYANARAFVFPSLYEGFGLPPLEAMLLGCPVVSSSAASMPEICGDAALYFDPGSIADMTTALTRIVSDEALRIDLKQRGAARAQQFTWSKAARQLFTHLSRAGLVTGSTL